MKVVRILFLTLLVLSATIITITACGGGNGSGGSVKGRAFIFNANPVGFHVTSGFGSARASLNGPFVVNAQASTPGGGNFPGFCNSVVPTTGRAATVIYGIGRWSSGSCEDAATPDSDVGVAVPQAGQIGNLTVDAVGNGTAADSGAFEVKVIHSDGTQTITQITCNLGTSSVGAKVHCEDKNAAHHAAVVSGDQVSARMFYNAGDAYRAIRVNIEFATPTF